MKSLQILESTHVWSMLQHPNILQFLGVKIHQSDGGAIDLLAPFTPLGTLDEFVKSRSAWMDQSHSNRPSNACYSAYQQFSEVDTVRRVLKCSIVRHSDHPNRHEGLPKH